MGVLALAAWLLGCAALGLPVAHSDGNIGCLFSPSLCTPDVEWCYNDDAFGRCLQQNVDEEDLYRHELSPDELQELEREMERLLNMGYRWSHSYTQCLLQAMLYAYKIRAVYEPEVCSHLKDQDLSAALKAFESEKSLDPDNVAYVRFTPSVNNPNADFADEVYFPPTLLDSEIIPLSAQLGEPEEEYSRFDLEDSEPEPILEPILEDVPVIMEPSDDEEDQPEADYPNVGFSQKQFPFSLVRKKSIPQRRSPTHFSKIYNTPDDFRRGFESRDMTEGVVPEVQPYEAPVEERESDLLLARLKQMFQSARPQTTQLDPSQSILLPMLQAIGDNYPTGTGRETEVGGGYTEGGLVLVPDKQSDADHSLSEFLVGLNSDINWGFKRPERLDVKKPGPPFKTNNYAFKSEEDKSDKNKDKHSHECTEGSETKSQSSVDETTSKEEFETSKSEDNSAPQQLQDEVIAGPQKKTNNAKNPSEINMSGTDRYIDYNNFVFIEFKEIMKSWIEGKHIIDYLANLMNVPPATFDEIRVDRNGVQFRVVEPNIENLNASTVVQKLDGIKDLLKKDLKVTVTSAGIGDKSRYEIIAGPQKKTYNAKNPSEINMSGTDRYNIVNNNFAFIEFKEIIKSWKEGEHIIEHLAKLMNVPPSTFDEIRVDRNEVTFRVVEPNIKNLNASTVVQKLDGIKDLLKKDLKVTVTSAGIGDKTKLPTMLSLSADADREFIVLLFIICAIFVTLVLVTSLVFLLVRRYSASRAKIRSLATPDTEASKDYQELCRARMAAKPPHDTAPTPASHRIASLSRESDNSPSSRSSTSSWSEEPALTSMDISTGHMVLSYMEDHLRNKDRLETEWAALCAYEAEPCATIIAQRPENTKKNRYVNALPYDHARVVLNELSNISGSDYINASTITDHDPRNPAYIATQGPLPHTAADLWQMVWEQGCVVMVMLTRLIENDVVMCHRYWPEEGSELYHIYEVHLVSEHFWCDDYLVRSFYLKNLKTTETRTVTQFHFLSWPEGGVPSSTKALLEFRRKVNKSFRGRSCPIVVHCSDGVGRTGTYCLLDMVLNRMAKGAKEIDIAATLEHIRDQRAGCVATKQQFQFVLQAVAEEVQAILRILPQPPTTQPSGQ